MALAEGRGVTAKVRWVARSNEDGRSRWIHCTPLFGSNGQIGVWMVILIDEDQELGRRWKLAPPVAPHVGKSYSPSLNGYYAPKDKHEPMLHDLRPSGSIRAGQLPREYYGSVSAPSLNSVRL